MRCRSEDALLDLLASRRCDDVAPGLLASRALSPRRTRRRASLAGAGREHRGAATIWSRGDVDAERKWTSTSRRTWQSSSDLSRRTPRASVQASGLDGALGGGCRCGLLGHVLPPVVQTATWSPPRRRRSAEPSGLVRSSVYCRTLRRSRRNPLRRLFSDSCPCCGVALDDLHRGVDVVGVEVGILVGDGADWSRVTVRLVGWARPSPCRCREPRAHGGRRSCDEGDVRPYR